jgi:hypothetical protein
MGWQDGGWFLVRAKERYASDAKGGGRKGRGINKRNEMRRREVQKGKLGTSVEI